MVVPSPGCVFLFISNKLEYRVDLYKLECMEVRLGVERVKNKHLLRSTSGMICTHLRLK